ncbi:hypothetical protein WJX84_009229 [Apatococcus fuscideae]|uniref:Uncharacterized protein n=1 Tax=Apatococcus fuscideae TaxID=2026836 RepID=A0AAW1SVQ3_9CHLO
MSSGRARSALSESLLGRVSQHRQALHSQETPQSVSLDITSSPRDSGEGSFEGRTPVDHRNTPFYGSPWPHLMRAGQAGSFPQRASMPARPRDMSPSRIQRGFGEPPPIFARDPQHTPRAASLDVTAPLPDTIPESPQRRLSRVSYAASEGRAASSTDGHPESGNDSMGYWDANGSLSRLAKSKVNHGYFAN